MKSSAREKEHANDRAVNIREPRKTMNLAVRFIRFFNEDYHDARKYFIVRFLRNNALIFLYLCVYGILLCDENKKSLFFQYYDYFRINIQQPINNYL